MGRQRFFVTFVMILTICGLVFTVSCTKPKVKSDTEELETVESTLPEDETATMEMAEEQTDEMVEEEAIRQEQQKARQMFENENIHFEFDRSSLTSKAQEILRRKATFLMNNPDVSVLIEGHCDERGTDEYNLALGDRRAKSAMDFLVDLGVEPSRLSTISYGEEQPLDPRSNEIAWARNRRAHFEIR
ncbi:MAG: peptidoglycan-associated lipoprotein Pal [Thermodesulfobacteriota bacterium]|nr:peptidoglycan-associated lipoprotein Pal [Thermodesulfobacteriota bacterium]